MGKSIGIGGTGSGVGTVAIAPPGQPTISRVDVIDITPDADGNQRKKIALLYAPPDPLGTFTGVWCYLDAPDTSGALTVADGTAPADGTSPEGGTFKPTSEGFFPYDPASPQISFISKAPAAIEFWRVYLVPGSDRIASKPIQHGQPGESASHQFVCLPPAGPGDGREFAPLVRDVVLTDITDEAILGWTSNPQYEAGESGDQLFQTAVSWAWPEDDQNFSALAGVNIVLDDGTTQTYIGNVAKTQAPLWLSQQFPLKNGTINYRVFLESYDTSGNRNSQVDGVTPFVDFSTTRNLGAAGVEYCAKVLADGVHPFATAAPIAGADGTSLLRITGYWANPSDPQFGGAELVVKKPDGNFYTVKSGRISPIENDISQPATVQTWRFYMRSIDINGRRNSISDVATPWVDISVGNPNGQLNLAKVSAGTFSNEFQVVGGVFKINALSAGTVITGQLQVGGGGNKVSQFKVFDTLNSLIGWIGDDTGVSGFVGGWFKQLRIGGASPSAAPIVANSSGVVSVSGSIVVGAVASANSVPASGITTPGTITVSSTLAFAGSGNLLITSTGGVVIQSAGGLSIGSSSPYAIFMDTSGGIFAVTVSAGVFKSGASTGQTDNIDATVLASHTLHFVNGIYVGKT